MDDLMTATETAALAHVSVPTLHRWRAEGTGPQSFRIGRRVLYRRADVELWLDEQYAAAGGRKKEAAGA